VKVVEVLLALSILLAIGCTRPCLAAGSANADSLDDYDAVLLYAPSLSLNSDKMFEEMCSYFGLRCRKVDVSTEPVSDSIFVDENGLPIRACAISALALCRSAAWVDSSEVSVLTQHIDSGALNLLVMDVRPSSSISDFGNLSLLTHGEVLGLATPVRSTKNYTVTASRPDICRELTGQSFMYNETQTDFGVSLADESPHVTRLVTSNDASGNPFPVLVAYTDGGGTVFVSSGTEYYNPATTQLMGLFNHRYFSGAVLLALFIKYAGGEECWHRDFDLANFTVDDPPLTSSSGYFSYPLLLEQMVRHHFHTTVAFIPKNVVSCDTATVSLFRENESFFSLVQHGNNHDGYEFYKYVADEGDSFPARPLPEQETDIVEGMYRMRELERLTGLRPGRVMIFPYASSPQETYFLLKKYNFLATVNGSVTGFNLPLDAVAPTDFSFDMYPACLDYENFTAMYRWMPSSGFSPVPLACFLDKSVLVFQHASYFGSTITAFNSFADSVNSLNANVVWASLDYIAKHSWLMKQNDDGTFDVMLLGRRAMVSNPSSEVRTLRLKKREDFALPVLAVKVNGGEHAYSVDNAGLLAIEVQLDPGDSADVEIEYGQGDIDFAVSPDDLAAGFVPGTDSVKVPVYNQGTVAGAVAVEFFDGEPASGGTLVGYRTVWIPGNGTCVVSVPWDWTSFGTSLYVRLDPYDFTHESDEDNNQASLRVEDKYSRYLRVTGTHPNPFASATWISFTIPLPAGTVLDGSPLPAAGCDVEIMDVSGRRVTQLFSGALTPGTHYLQWTGKNDLGVIIASGVYFCVLESEGKRDVRKILYLR
jgi:hypothetical protein